RKEVSSGVSLFGGASAIGRPRQRVGGGQQVASILAASSDALLSAESAEEVRALALNGALAIVGGARGGAMVSVLDAGGRRLESTDRSPRPAGKDSVRGLPKDVLRRLASGAVVMGAVRLVRGEQALDHTLLPLRGAGRLLGVLSVHAEPAQRAEVATGLRVLALAAGLALAQIELRDGAASSPIAAVRPPRHQVTADGQAFGDQLRHQAIYDPLTSLPNRSIFLKTVAGALESGAARPGHCAVLIADVDNFQAINDAAGHTVGDAILLETAQRIERVLRHEDAAARLGGDEFGVMLGGLEDLDEACTIARRLLMALRQPIEIGTSTWLTSASVGLAFNHPRGRGAKELLRDADLAVASAKRHGRAALGVFEEGMEADALERVVLEHDLRMAIDGGQLRLEYQPVIELRDGRLTGVEALVRWDHPTRGLLPPDRFIPLAEKVGLIHEIDEWVIAAAMAQAQAWATKGLGLLRMAINLSGTHFVDAGIDARIELLRVAAGQPASSVEFEVTETVAIESPSAPAALSAMRDRGYRKAIDDFGVGYSMLSRLQDYPIDTLKIERSFVKRVTRAEEEAPIVAGIIAMAHSLGLNVVGEGVETKAQLDCLRSLGCDQAQGFVLGRPLSPETVEQLLYTRQALQPAVPAVN
ncbi:MAG: putative bifunctional diguanylate cyclase/phosphodiesterase, partial [Candidatus Dormibacteria bacterium]